MKQAENKKQKIKEFLEQMYGKQLNAAEVQEHKERLVKLFALLIEVDQRNKKKK